MDWIAILILLVRCLVLALAWTTLFAYFTLFERRLLARFQNRVGSNRAGYIPLPGGKKLFGGVLQPAGTMPQSSFFYEERHPGLEQIAAVSIDGAGLCGTSPP
jgi:hypothetical protein